MPRSPLALAALATAAVPGFDAFDARRTGAAGTDVDGAVVTTADGHRWVVRAPRTPAAGAAMEAETVLLRALAAHVDSEALPFAVPRPAGFADLPEGGRAVVHPLLRGRPLQLERLGPGPGLAAQIGRAIARIHELPPEIVEDAGLPVYDADAYRRRRLSEVDEAAGTGRVPGSLLRRWEHALEDVSMWRFQPVVTHGDLTSEHVLCVGDAVTAVVGWSEAKVADPADDLAWLLVAAPQEAVDPILESYAVHRADMRDAHLADRALLAGELALARWLLHGVRTQDASVVDDAAAMLVELDEETADQVVPIGSGWSSSPEAVRVAHGQEPATDEPGADAPVDDVLDAPEATEIPVDDTHPGAAADVEPAADDVPAVPDDGAVDGQEAAGVVADEPAEQSADGDVSPEESAGPRDR